MSARKKPISSNFIEKQANVWGKSVRWQGNIIKDDMKILFKGCVIAEASRKPLFANLKILDVFSIYILTPSKFFHVPISSWRFTYCLLKSLKLEIRFINIQQDTLTFTNLIPVLQTNIKKFLVVFQGPRIRNSLPNNIRNAPTFNISKRVIKPFLRVSLGTT